MLKSLPVQLALTILVVGFGKWLLLNRIGYPGVYFVAAGLAFVWIALATRGGRILARLRARRSESR